MTILNQILKYQVSFFRIFVSALILLFLVSTSGFSFEIISGPDTNWQQEGIGDGQWLDSYNGANYAPHRIYQPKNSSTPTFWISHYDFINGTISGKFEIQHIGNSLDDDAIGFVLGYTNPINTNPTQRVYDTIVLSWTKGGFEQPQSLYLFKTKFVATDSLTSGMWYSETPYKANNPFFWISELATGNPAHSMHFNTGYNVILDSKPIPWKYETPYTIHLNYSDSEISVTINETLSTNDTDNIVATLNSKINDITLTPLQQSVHGNLTSFPKGRFGFYNFSQAHVKYENFSDIPTTISGSCLPPTFKRRGRARDFTPEFAKSNAVTVCPDIYLSGPDVPNSITLQFYPGFNRHYDRLIWDDTLAIRLGIAAVYHSDTGTLMFIGKQSVLNYTDLLRSVKYYNYSDVFSELTDHPHTPSTNRKIKFQIDLDNTDNPTSQLTLDTSILIDPGAPLLTIINGPGTVNQGTIPYDHNNVSFHSEGDPLSFTSRPIDNEIHFLDQIHFTNTQNKKKRHLVRSDSPHDFSLPTASNGLTYLNGKMNILTLFFQNKWVISPNTGSNGIISPDTKQYFITSQNITFQVIPEPGHFISTINVTPSLTSPISLIPPKNKSPITFSISDIRSHHTIQTEFLPFWTIDINKIGEGLGWITAVPEQSNYSGSQLFSTGETVLYTFTPNPISQPIPSYIEQLVISRNGDTPQIIDIDAPYGVSTTHNFVVSTHYSVDVRFQELAILTVSSNLNDATIAIPKTSYYTHHQDQYYFKKGQHANIHFIAPDHYLISTLNIDSTPSLFPQSSEFIYTLENITSNHTIKASFKPFPKHDN